MELTPGLNPHSSLLDLRRQSELPSPHNLKDLLAVKRADEKPSILEKERVTCGCWTLSTKAIAYKNLLGVSLSYWIIFSALLTAIGLQSSLNDELGLASSSILYVVFLISGFYTSAMLRLLGTKINLLISYTAMLVYTLSNYYPQWYTLVTGAVCLGIFFGPLWGALNVHITTVARRFAEASDKNPAHLIALFTGIHTMFYKLSYVPANLASTIILFTRSTDDLMLNTSFEGKLCNSTGGSDVGEVSLYIILSVFVVFHIVAIVIVFSLVDHLGTSTRRYPFGEMVSRYFLDPLIATLKMFLDWKMWMILPMMALDGFVISFALGRFARYYVSDCIGVQWIGLVQMVFGVFSAFTAVVNGRLVKVVPQYVMVYLTALLNLGVLFFLLFWERVPSHPVVFVTMAAWGACDGVWNSVPPSLVGVLFPKSQEAAYSVLRIGLACGFIFGFLGALLLSIEVQYYIAICFIAITAITASVLFFKSQSKEELFPLCYKRKVVELTDAKQNGEMSNGDVLACTNRLAGDFACNSETRFDDIVNTTRKETEI